MDLQEPSKKMSTTGGTPQGTVLIADPPDVVRKKFKSGGHRLRVARCDAAPDKPGITNLIEIMSVATGETPEAIEARFDEPGLRRVQGRRSARRWSRCSTRSRSATEELRADAGELRRLLAIGADKAREASAPTLAAMYERMGFTR